LKYIKKILGIFFKKNEKVVVEGGTCCSYKVFGPLLVKEIEEFEGR